MLMMWVTPASTTSIIFGSFHMPPPTPIWSVTQVMSMPLQLPRAEPGPQLPAPFYRAPLLALPGGGKEPLVQDCNRRPKTRKPRTGGVDLRGGHIRGVRF